MRSFLKGWGPALLWAAGIFFLSSRPALDAPGLDLPGADKAAHLAAYAVLGALLSHGGTPRGVSPWLLVLLGALYGASDEIHQSFVPGRQVDLLDWTADLLGAAAGVFAHRRWARTRLTPPSASPRDAGLLER